MIWVFPRYVFETYSRENDEAQKDIGRTILKRTGQVFQDYNNIEKAVMPHILSKQPARTDLGPASLSGILSFDHTTQNGKCARLCKGRREEIRVQKEASTCEPPCCRIAQR